MASFSFVREVPELRKLYSSMKKWNVDIGVLNMNIMVFYQR